MTKWQLNGTVWHYNYGDLGDGAKGFYFASAFSGHDGEFACTVIGVEMCHYEPTEEKAKAWVERRCKRLDKLKFA